jgi:hypothetical protein
LLNIRTSGWKYYSPPTGENNPVAICTSPDGYIILKHFFDTKWYDLLMPIDGHFYMIMTGLQYIENNKNKK